MEMDSPQFKQLSFPGFNMAAPNPAATRTAELDAGAGNKTEESKNALANSSMPDAHLSALGNTRINGVTDEELNGPVGGPGIEGFNGFRAKGFATGHSDPDNPNTIQYVTGGKADEFSGMMVHEAAHVLQPKHQTELGPGTGNLLGPVAYTEGAAEGYRLAHDPVGQQHGYFKQPTSMYTPEFFGEKKLRDDYLNNPDSEAATQAKKDASELFGLSKQFSAMTGDPGFHAAEDSRVAQDMTGVLPGERRLDTSSQARMHSAQIGRRMNPDNFPHMQEFKDRHRAAFGQTIQGSMLPDLVPEHDQFGDAPMEEVPRSEQGKVMYAKNVEGRKIKHSETSLYGSM